MFALEHGLDQTEAQLLATAVRNSIANSAPSREHALPWIVYAAELGYRYSGDEYWQTFESETPGWTDHGDRYWIRDRFRSFHVKFGGAKPSGAWAERFSIICWPITHAILPLDLQRQLAQILYEIRYSFSAEVFESPFKLGEFIAAKSWNTSSRFQIFAQETALVGQIAAALLLRGEFGTGSLIHPATLHRISEDLDHERLAREWLRGARRFAEERASIRGLGPGWGPTSTIPHHPEQARAEVVALGIEPRLVLRPTDVLGTSWEVSLEIPDLSHLLFRFPQTRDVLTGSRCVVAGAAGRPLARRWVLHGAKRVALAQWPRPDEVLLQFEHSVPELDFLLHTECLLRPANTRLFRIASDGLAYESRSLRVRPGESYVIVSDRKPVGAIAHVRPITLLCQRVYGAILGLPAALTADWEATLRSLGLGLAKTIEVWPAGLAALVWDGEGHGEWLASERPCLGIRTDHPSGSLVVSISGSTEPPLELTSITPGEPIFVELPQLPVGLHTVRVFTRSDPKAETEPLGDLEVVMRIREAHPWLPGVSANGPLLIQIDPDTPTLEQLWEGQTEVTLWGPPGRNVKCRASLFARDSEPANVVKKLPPMTLPITADGWRTHFEKYFIETKEVQDSYDAARICKLDFSADELGAFTIRCEREFTPLRWAVRRHGAHHIIRLIDDSGSAASPTAVQLAFETPSKEESLENYTEYEVPPVGGLYVARSGEFTTAIIVPPMVRDLAGLRCSPHFDRLDRSVESLVKAVRLARLWGQARVTGGVFSVGRQRDVLHALTSEIFRILGGDRWANSEGTVQDRPDRIEYLKRAVTQRREEFAIGETLALQSAALATAACRDRVESVESLATRVFSLPPPPPEKLAPGLMIIRRNRPPSADDPKWLSELALRLASDPGGVEVWAGQYLRAGIQRLFEVPTLARAARFFVIAIHIHLQSRASTGELYAGWRWG